MEVIYIDFMCIFTYNYAEMIANVEYEWKIKMKSLKTCHAQRKV